LRRSQPPHLTGGSALVRHTCEVQTFVTGAGRAFCVCDLPRRSLRSDTANRNRTRSPLPTTKLARHLPFLVFRTSSPGRGFGQPLCLAYWFTPPAQVLLPTLAPTVWQRRKPTGAPRSCVSVLPGIRQLLPRVIPSRASPVPDIARLSPDARSPLMELSYSPAYSHQGGIALLVQRSRFAVHRPWGFPDPGS
jgi:hypothetical protein